MTGRFLNVAGSPVSIGGGAVDETVVAFNADAAAWEWATGGLTQLSLIGWSTGSAITTSLDATGITLSGVTAAVTLEAGATDKSFAMASTGAAAVLCPRWVDINNYVAWTPQFSAPTGRLRVRTAGVNTDEVVAGLYSAATNWGIEVIGNTINMYGNGVLVASRTVTAHASTTKAMIGHGSGAAVTMTVTRLQSGTTALV